MVTRFRDFLYSEKHDTDWICFSCMTERVFVKKCLPNEKKGAIL